MYHQKLKQFSLESDSDSVLGQPGSPITEYRYNLSQLSNPSFSMVILLANQICISRSINDNGGRLCISCIINGDLPEIYI